MSPRTNSVGMNKRPRNTNFAMQVNNLSLAFYQFTAVSEPHVGLADMHCKVPVTLSILS